jgi:hypothetical protein
VKAAQAQGFVEDVVDLGEQAADVLVVVEVLGRRMRPT